MKNTQEIDRAFQNFLTLIEATVVITLLTLIISFSLSSCKYFPNKERSDQQIADAIFVSISTLKSKELTTAISELAKRVKPLQDGKLTLGEAFNEIRNLRQRNGKPLINAKSISIIELGFKFYLPEEFEEIKITKGRKLLNIIKILDERFKE